MDGKVEVFRDVITHRVADGVLTIEAPPSDPLAKYRERMRERPARPTTRHLVLANIREYTIEDRR
jgi:hypothetical protein